MRDRLYVSSGSVFQVDKHSFGIAETSSGYTLYASINCPDQKTGEEAWKNLEAGQNCPDGWKVCSNAIPADTQHNIYDVIPGTLFYMKGLTGTTYLRY